MRIKATIAALAISTASIIAAVVPGTPAMATVLACPDNGWSIKDGGSGHLFAVSGAHIRTGPDTACTSLGLGYPSHVVRLDCKKGTWSHILNHTTGVLGWVHNSNLTNLPLQNC